MRYPADELLAILALESYRAQAFVVGEDLGTVEAAMRDQLDAHRLLSYRLLWFETEPPSRYPARALAAVTTHDLPTIAGLWSGADLQAQHDLGLQPNAAGLQAIRQRLQAMTGLPDTAAVEEVVLRTHQLLAEAPSAVLVATLEDALAVAERPNMPNTTTEWPNWSRALPCPLRRSSATPSCRPWRPPCSGGKATRVERVVSPWRCGDALECQCPPPWRTMWPRQRTICEEESEIMPLMPFAILWLWLRGLLALALLGGELWLLYTWYDALPRTTPVA